MSDEITGSRGLSPDQAKLIKHIRELEETIVEAINLMMTDSAIEPASATAGKANIQQGFKCLVRAIAPPE